MTTDYTMAICIKFRGILGIAICGIFFTACTKTPHPYSLQTPIAQSGPQHILLGQGMDLNSSDVAALEALPGVGPALALRIVEYRSTHGPFTSIQDLYHVSGIGEKTLQKLATLLRVQSNK